MYSITIDRLGTRSAFDCKTAHIYILEHDQIRMAESESTESWTLGSVRVQ
mgnify:CR=1 FL=1